jgi:Flp pilus assembly protein CpaB
MAERNPIVRSSRRLPSGRAVIGALLITLSVLAVLVVLRLDDDSAYQEIVVARRDLAPGTVLEVDDLARVRIRLDESVDFVVTDPDDATGSILLGPLARLEFLQQSNLASTGTGGSEVGLAEISVAVRPDRAPEDLTPGEVVSLVATFTDDDPETRLIADRVVVLSYSRDDDEFGNDGVLRLGLTDGAVAMDIVHASQTGELSVVGIMGAPDLVLPERSP